MKKKKYAAFTIVELLVTLGVVAILASIAVPSFAEAIRNNRIVAQANDFLTAMHYARGEAVRRNEPVRICVSADGVTCAASTEWERGWLIYADADADGTLDAGELLRSWGGLQGGNTLRMPSGAVSTLSYDSRGLLDARRQLVLCDSRGLASGRAIAVSAMGRASVSAPNNDGELFDLSGNQINSCT